MPDDPFIASPGFCRVAPAGSRISRRVLRASSGRAWGQCKIGFFDSATAALAVAIKASFAHLADPSRPKVLLPAYGCPNLLAATLWAGGEPEWLDLLPDDLVPDAAVVAERTSDRDAVAVCVDAFGVPSAANPLLNSSSARHELLIHDLAQSFSPFVERWSPALGRSIVSFGRAKPVSLTLGGALILAPGTEIHKDEMYKNVRATLSPYKLLIRALIYNLSLQPAAFGALSRLSFLGIGRTRFVRLRDVTAMNLDLERFVVSAVMDFRSRQSELLAASRRMINLVMNAGVSIPACATIAGSELPIWRVPVVTRDEVSALRAVERGRHLGLSQLYGKTMPEYSGVDSAQAKRRWPVAWQLSRRLITLPAHGRLRHGQFDEIGAILSESSGQRSLSSSSSA